MQSFNDEILQISAQVNQKMESLIEMNKAHTSAVNSGLDISMLILVLQVPILLLSIAFNRSKF